MKTNTHFRSYVAHFFLKWKMFQIKIVAKLETHVLCIYFLNRAICEIMWENVLERGRSQMTIWRTRIACCLPKAANTHSEYVILNVFSLQQLVARTLLNFTLYVHYPSCFVLLWIEAECKELKGFFFPLYFFTQIGTRTVALLMFSLR